MELAPLTVLKKQYTIKRTLGEPGPFDIKYLGEDVDSKDPYVIREFFPTSLVKRESGKTSVEVKGDDDDADAFQSGIEYFEKESKVLAELDHKVIASNYSVFEANGTVYRARPHQASMSLAKGLRNRGQLSEKAALTIMIPVLEGLQAAHDDGLYHGGVSPDTVRLLEDGSVMLTGFRGAFIQLARQRGQLSDLVQPGTSAIEQYTPRGNQGPWTDVYAVAATILQMVTGSSIPEASDRLEGEDPLMEMIQDADVFSSPGVREALVDALAVDPSKRLQSAESLANALKESSERYDEADSAYSIMPVETEEDDEEAPAETDDEEVEVLSTAGDRPSRSSSGSSQTKEKEESSSNVALMVGLPLLVVLVGGGAWFMMSSGGASAGDNSTAYADYRSRADSLYEAEEYQQARRVYRRALQQREDDEYVQQRLDRIDQMMEESSQRQYEQAMARGDSLKQRADELFSNGNTDDANTVYSRAMAAYFSALDANSGDEAANRKIDQIERRQETIAKQQATGGSGEVDLTQIASFFRTQAESQLEAGNLQAALRKYKQAAEYSENPKSLQKVIADLEQEIKQQERNQRYETAFNRGERMMRQDNYSEAQKSFQAALDVKSTKEARSALDRAEKLLTEKRETQQQYKQYRTQGDEAYQQGNYETAVEAYKQALKVKPNDSYAQGQLEKAQEELEQLQLAKAKQEEAEQRRENMIGPDGVYKVVDEDPKVKGGLGELHKNVEYPEVAARQGIEGRVYVQAVVNKDGTVRSAEVARGIGGGCDREALRVVRDAQFVPAKVDGKPVPARTTVWIQFSLSGQGG